ncbi:MAG: GAF and ANTAR domain-containing protein [Micromonosporaceae bacterium]|nr:GAF and ANTAR domain-containing protein [Micromonosporaceae bacterium]
MGADLHVVEIVSVLRKLTTQLIFSDSLDDALETLTGTTARLLDGPSFCDVTVVGRHGPSSAASSPGLPELLSKVQYETGHGPCMTAIGLHEVTVSQDLARETRWPGWTAWAADNGIRGALAAPIDVDGDVIGALSLYAGAPDRFGPDVELTMMLLAEQAGLLLAGVRERGQGTTWIRRQAPPPDTGDTVNTAVGIVMAQRGCSPEHGLEALRQASSTLRLPVEALAERLVEIANNRTSPSRRIPRTRPSVDR